MPDKIDIEKLLSEGNTVMLEPIGTSMYPLFVDRHDKAVIISCNQDQRKLRRGDVCIYRRDNGRLIIHRIVRIKKQEIFFVGDHQRDIEGPIDSKKVMGRMVSFVRKGREYSVNNPVYIVLSRVWLCLRPIRLHMIRIGSFFKKIFTG